MKRMPALFLETDVIRSQELENVHFLLPIWNTNREMALHALSKASANNASTPYGTIKCLPLRVKE